MDLFERSDTTQSLHVTGTHIRFGREGTLAWLYNLQPYLQIKAHLYEELLGTRYRAKRDPS